jgi:hypothetical protein
MAAFLMEAVANKYPRACVYELKTKGERIMSGIPVIIIGELYYSGLSVGGGPMPGGPPLGIWGGAPPPWPSHPIAPGGLPPQIWPLPGYPAHPIAPGGPPPGIWPSPGYPSHPIAPGGQPPGYWGGAPLPWPTPPMAPGGGPTHPIVLPPVQPGGPPVEIWPKPGVPTHPIVLPPPPSGEAIKPPPPEGGWAYTPLYGWGYFPPQEVAQPK